MKLDDWIDKNVAHVDLLPLLNHIGMFPHHQPSNVGEEKAPFGIVWICVRFGKLVVNAMISDPFEYWILQQESMYSKIVK